MADFLLSCCCGPLLTTEDDEDLYALLEVPRNAPTDDIRRAYRRKSLRLHPDKVAQRGEQVTAEHRAAFQQLQRAWEILRDNEKRKVYDRVGTLGIRIMEDPMGANAELGKRFLNAPASYRMRFVFFVFLFFAFLCLFPFLAAAEIDDDADLSWLAIAVPVWIYNAFALLYHGYMLFVFKNPGPDVGEDGEELPPDEDMPHISLAARLYDFLKFSLRLAQVITLLTALDGHFEDEIWGLILLPLFIYLGLEIGEALFAYFIMDIELPPGFDPQDPDMLLTIELERDEQRTKKYRALEYLFFLLQTLILVLRLDDYIDESYWVLSLPLFGYIAVSLYLRVVKPNVEAAVILERPPEETNPTEDELLDGMSDEFKEAKAALITRNVMSYAGSLCCQLLMLILLLVRIEEADFSVYILYLPILIPMTCFFCCLCLSILTVDEQSMEDAWAAQHEAGDGPVPTDEPADEAVPIIIHQDVENPAAEAEPAAGAAAEAPPQETPTASAGASPDDIDVDLD
uniref:J domain-containing protein n=1 Tax=Phaeomonas parva TaxID=124430 RepID=A0A7S1XIQ0_9STRA|mmetsp:Transcript_11719/g.35566  ORF Transcript_11719/g.35566 Transcript_11719/m.35566 type:complete len:514 (+) Transcript_11719:99-1640(+)|eukprot:CAMPEP_0118855842 /NCGR_PEP_ID=MMETSP1163-20130328/3525_1 /TAXON_ID=124430 /ORGANISM="Phaeomonas parva, Strain CCMP2877" /LENGTH=513 /DNA_ID=CAMNT_0006788807 /DNA_START=67 /DNA_END=1608 /DNA_ORIENTATION=-